MKIETRQTKENGIIQITTHDERWYAKNQEDGSVKYVPSVTWVCGHYPKGIAFYKWLADKGWDEAEALKNAAGDRGSKVHKAIETLMDGQLVKIDDKFVNPTTNQPEELTIEEYDAILSFANWFNEVKPKIIAAEFVVFNDEENYAGTVDLLCEIDKEVWLIDFKTSQSVWSEYELQVSAYKHAMSKKIDKLGILQVGYKKNKAKWKMNEVEDKFPLFQAAQQIWANEQEGVTPKQKDYPVSVQLNGVKK